MPKIKYEVSLCVLISFAALVAIACVAVDLLSADSSVIKQLNDLEVDLYETVVIEEPCADALVLGPVQTKAFRDEGNTVFVPRKEGTYYVFLAQKSVSSGKSNCVVRVLVGASDDISDDDVVEPNAPVSTFRKKFREILLSNVPEVHRAVVCGKLADACAYVRAKKFDDEEKLLEEYKAANVEALDWDNGSDEFRTAWFNFFNDDGPLDNLINETYTDKVDWEKVLADMEAVYRELK